MHHTTDRITHTTAFVTPVVEHWLEQEIAQWVHHEGSIRRPIATQANALTTELHLAPLTNGGYQEQNISQNVIWRCVCEATDVLKLENSSLGVVVVTLSMSLAVA